MDFWADLWTDFWTVMSTLTNGRGGYSDLNQWQQ